MASTVLLYNVRTGQMVLEILALLVAGILLLFLTRWTYVGIGAGIVIIGASCTFMWIRI
jgi:hypothetical protein